MKYVFLFCLFLIGMSCNSPQSTSATEADAQAQNTPEALFKQGDAGYACFRIPAILKAADGSILAFCEARQNGCSDTGDIDLVMKKSTDNGITWGPLQVIWDNGENVCGNPAPVLEEESGDIHLLSTWNRGEDHESEIIDERSIDTRRIFQLVSRDNGASWETPREITDDVKLPNWTWYATGPVHGIQLKKGTHKGRLVIPCDHIEAGSKKYFSHVIYSDDRGLSWKLGGTTPEDQVNECSVAELSNGDLMLNMRNYKRTDARSRQVAISKDGGDTWIEQRFDEQLPEPRCQAALLPIVREGKQLLLFSNPAHAEKRMNMTVSLSEDDGKSWTRKSPIYASHSAYSDLVETQNQQILLLHEGGKKSAYDAIYVSRVDLN